MESEIPKLRRADESKKITIYLDPEALEIYRAAKKNGWDAPKIARQAVEAALFEKKLKLAKKAE